MVKVLEIGDRDAVKENHYKVTCNHCNSELAVQESVIWVEDPSNGIGRIECPICRRKVFLSGLKVVINPITEITAEQFDSAHSDMSKSGLQMLIDAKKKEVSNS